MNYLINSYRFLFARPQCRKINEVLFHLSLRGLGILNFENAQVSGEDYLLNEILPKLIKSNQPVLIDIGANVGKYSCELSRKFPGARLYAFEPHPKNYTKLCCANLGTSAKLYNKAVGSAKGRLILYDRADSDGYHACFFI